MIEQIKIEALHHVSITVSDIARAKHFYGEILGLRELERPPFDYPGAWYALGDQQLHLIVHSDSRTMRGAAGIDSRDGHFALRVRSYNETLQYLKAHSIELIDRPVNKTPWSQIYAADPDGNVIEFNAERPD